MLCAALRKPRMTKKLEDTSVLVVEDERGLNEAYITILKASSIRAEGCYDGEEALERLKSFHPDVILLDLRMPKMDGLRFLEELSAQNISPRPKVILFSNFDEQKDIDRAFALGATKYLLKAWVSPDQLITLITETV